MEDLWQALQASNYPPRVVDTMSAALEALATALTDEGVAASSQAAVDVAQSALDLELLHRGNVEADRFHLHAQQLRVHAANSDLAGLTGEVAVPEWIRDRLAGSLTRPDSPTSTPGSAPCAAPPAPATCSPPPITPPGPQPDSEAPDRPVRGGATHDDSVD